MGMVMFKNWTARTTPIAAAVELRMRSRILEDRFFLDSLSADEVTSCPGAAATRSSGLQHPAHDIFPARLVCPQTVQMTVGSSTSLCPAANRDLARTPVYS